MPQHRGHERPLVRQAHSAGATATGPLPHRAESHREVRLCDMVLPVGALVAHARHHLPLLPLLVHVCRSGYRELEGCWQVVPSKHEMCPQGTRPSSHSSSTFAAVGGQGTKVASSQGDSTRCDQQRRAHVFHC